MPEPMPCDPPVTITVFDVPDIFRSPSRDLKVNEAIGRKAWSSMLPFAISCSDRCRGIVPCHVDMDHLLCGANAIQDRGRIMGRSGSPRTHPDGGRSAAQARPQRTLHFAPRRSLRGGEGGLRLCCLARTPRLSPISAEQAGLRYAYDHLLFGPAAARAADIRDELERLPTDVLLSDTALFGSTMAAEAAGIPCALLSPTISLRPLPGVPPLGSRL